MDGIVNAVKDTLKDALSHDKDKQQQHGQSGGNGGYGQSEGNGGYRGEHHSSSSGYGEQHGSGYGGARQGEIYGGGRDRDERGYGGRDEPRRDEYDSGRRDEYGSGSGYGGHGGRQQDLRPAGYGHDSVRDTRGYSRDDAPPPSYREEGSYGGRGEEEASGYGGHGGRSGVWRIEDDRYDSGSREYRPAQGSAGYVHSPNYDGAREYAERDAGHAGETSLFSSALGMLRGREKDLERDDVDEREVVRNHRELYEDGGDRGHQQKSSQSLAQAAAMQALKRFTGGGSDSSGSSGGKDSNAFIGLAMAEAVKLFDSQSAKGNVVPGETKQDVVSQAAQFALKLFLKSKLDGGSGGGMGGGSGSGLLSLASQFMK